MTTSPGGTANADAMPSRSTAPRQTAPNPRSTAWSRRGRDGGDDERGGGGADGLITGGRDHDLLPRRRRGPPLRPVPDRLVVQDGLAGHRVHLQWVQGSRGEPARRRHPTAGRSIVGVADHAVGDPALGADPRQSYSVPAARTPAAKAPNSRRLASTPVISHQGVAVVRHASFGIGVAPFT